MSRRARARATKNYGGRANGVNNVLENKHKHKVLQTLIQCMSIKEYTGILFHYDYIGVKTIS